VAPPGRRKEKAPMMFKNPFMLWGLLLLPVLTYLLFGRERERTLSTPFFAQFPSRTTMRVWIFLFARGLLVLALGLFIAAMARPQKGYIEETIETEGIDIVLTLDISSSMKAEDFKPNRLGAAKAVAKEFISGRKTDKIGLVTFSRKAVTQSPLTTDYSLLYEFIDTIEIGMIPDGTAIGNALAESSKRLAGGKEKSKVLILLTDGINNSGEIDPITAAQAAKTLNIKIYTIGVGSMGNAPYPVQDQVFGTRYVSVPVQIDEEVLRTIAQITGGLYFRATDTQKLEDIYREIDQLEKSKIEIKQYRKTRERFTAPLLAGVVLFGMYMALSRTYLKTIP
jgi:Ca-activated chloride channel family protein